MPLATCSVSLPVSERRSVLCHHEPQFTAAMLLQMRREMHTFVLSRLQTIMRTTTQTLPPTLALHLMLPLVPFACKLSCEPQCQPLCQPSCFVRCFVRCQLFANLHAIIVQLSIAQVHANSSAHTILCGFESGRLTPCMFKVLMSANSSRFDSKNPRPLSGLLAVSMSSPHLHPWSVHARVQSVTMPAVCPCPRPVRENGHVQSASASVVSPCPHPVRDRDRGLFVSAIIRVHDFSAT